MKDQPAPKLGHILNNPIIEVILLMMEKNTFRQGIHNPKEEATRFVLKIS